MKTWSSRCRCTPSRTWRPPRAGRSCWTWLGPRTLRPSRFLVPHADWGFPRTGTASLLGISGAYDFGYNIRQLHSSLKTLRDNICLHFACKGSSLLILRRIVEKRLLFWNFKKLSLVMFFLSFRIIILFFVYYRLQNKPKPKPPGYGGSVKSGGGGSGRGSKSNSSSNKIVMPQAPAPSFIVNSSVPKPTIKMNSGKRPRKDAFCSWMFSNFFKNSKLSFTFQRATNYNIWEIVFRHFLLQEVLLCPRFRFPHPLPPRCSLCSSWPWPRAPRTLVHLPPRPTTTCSTAKRGRRTRWNPPSMLFNDQNGYIWRQLKILECWERAEWHKNDYFLEYYYLVAIFANKKKNGLNKMSSQFFHWIGGN